MIEVATTPAALKKRRLDEIDFSILAYLNYKSSELKSCN